MDEEVFQIDRMVQQAGGDIRQPVDYHGRGYRKQHADRQRILYGIASFLVVADVLTPDVGTYPTQCGHDRNRVVALL